MSADHPLPAPGRRLAVAFLVALALVGGTCALGFWLIDRQQTRIEQVVAEQQDQRFDATVGACVQRNSQARAVRRTNRGILRFLQAFAPSIVDRARVYFPLDRPRIEPDCEAYAERRVPDAGD